MKKLLKTFFSTWFRVIESPNKFFEQKKNLFTIKDALTYLVILTALIVICRVVGQYMLRAMLELKGMGWATKVVAEFSFRNLLMSIPQFMLFCIVQAVILFALNLIAKTKLVLNDVLAISVYSMSPLLFSALPVGVLGMLIPIWCVVILSSGIKKCAKTDKPRVWLIIGPYIAIYLIVGIVYTIQVVVPKTMSMAEKLQEASKKDNLRVYKMKAEKEGKKVEITEEGGSITRSYYKSGQLKSELCFNDVYAEWSKGYYEDGTLQREKYFKDGNETLTKRYYPDGNLEQEVRYLGGRENRDTKDYHFNGNLCREMSYRNDKREGIAKIYREDGTLKNEIYYENDKQVDRKYHPETYKE